MEEGRGERGRGRKREWIAIELKRKKKTKRMAREATGHSEKRISRRKAAILKERWMRYKKTGDSKDNDGKGKIR